ncbi:MAG: hypothetical protein K2J37_05365 [Ruminococcus sp.]|nr:hypothetical protein [Ruminococcus sp.]
MDIFGLISFMNLMCLAVASPLTGDRFPIVLLIIVVVIAIAGVVFSKMKKK